MSVLITCDELAAALAGPQPPIVLDARYNLMGPDGRQEFLDGHIPGARWVDVDHELAAPAGEGGRHPLPDPEVFVTAMRRVGLTADRPVVCADGGSALGASRLWWMLTDAGLTEIRVLDGGFTAWRAAGLEIASGVDQGWEPSAIELTPGQRSRVDADQLAGRVLVDVRTPERFAGECEPIDPVAGHIPGALNLPGAGSFAEGRFRPATELAEHFADLPENPVVYCGSGITAAQTLLAMEAAGRTDGTLYAGSWSDWITDPTRPVATGRS
ncbi:sulfurtransferase [Propionibacteriaceae bacterium Y1700]|uniref:sulfurtransferase n=1 Tax=Microlunatus sp. Y1700 TaxID=3418487 RepID=UPI003DA799EE